MTVSTKSEGHNYKSSLLIFPQQKQKTKQNNAVNDLFPHSSSMRKEKKKRQRKTMTQQKQYAKQQKLKN